MLLIHLKNMSFLSQIIFGPQPLFSYWKQVQMTSEPSSWMRMKVKCAVT